MAVKKHDGTRRASNTHDAAGVVRGGTSKAASKGAAKGKGKAAGKKGDVAQSRGKRGGQYVAAGYAHAPLELPATRSRAKRRSTRQPQRVPPDADDPALQLDEATRAVERAMSTLQEAAAQLQTLLASQVQRATVAAGEAGPALEHAAEVFKREVHALLGDDAPDDSAVRRAARQTVAEQAWERRVGALIDTSDVVALLGVSRQQVNALAKNRRLIALKQDGRHRFPAWQFAGTDAKQRACLAEAHTRLVDVAALSPWAATAWFLNEHPELGDLDPVTYLRAHGSCEGLVAAAQRDAARAAQ